MQEIANGAVFLFNERSLLGCGLRSREIIPAAKNSLSNVSGSGIHGARYICSGTSPMEMHRSRRGDGDLGIMIARKEEGVIRLLVVEK